MSLPINNNCRLTNFPWPTDTWESPISPPPFEFDEAQKYKCPDHGEVTDVVSFNHGGEVRGPMCLKCVAAFVKLLPTVEELPMPVRASANSIKAEDLMRQMAAHRVAQHSVTRESTAAAVAQMAQHSVTSVTPSIIIPTVTEEEKESWLKGLWPMKA